MINEDEKDHFTEEEEIVKGGIESGLVQMEDLSKIDYKILVEIIRKQNIMK